MKYIIRSVKYLFYFTFMCGLILVLTFHFSVKPEDLTLMDMLMVDGSIYKMLTFFVAVAAIYPALGFQKKEVYVSNFKEHKKEIIDLLKLATVQYYPNTPVRYSSVRLFFGLVNI